MKTTRYLKVFFTVFFLVSVLTSSDAVQRGASKSLAAPKASAKTNNAQSTPSASPQVSEDKSKAIIYKPNIIVQSLTYIVPKGRKAAKVFNEGEKTTISIIFLNKGKAKSSKDHKYSISCIAKGKGSKCPVKNTTKSFGKEIEPDKTYQVLKTITFKKAGEYHIAAKVTGEHGASQKTLKLKVVASRDSGRTKFKKKSNPGNKNKSAGQFTPTAKPSSKFKFQTQLTAKMFGGDFTKWVTEWKDTAPKAITFRWKTLKSTNAKSFLGRWQISKSLNFTNIIKQGNAGIVPDPGKGYQFFSIDFKKIVKSYPAPASFYVRVVPATESELYSASLPVTVKILEAKEDTFFSTQGLYPELWNPVKVRVSLSNFRIINPDEDKEEPYVVAVIVYADGTTVDLFNIGTSSVRIRSTKKTHGNIQFSGYTKRLEINEGPWNTTVLPIGLNVLEWAEDVIKQNAPAKGLFLKNTFIAVFVAALEEDETATSDVNRLKNKLVSSLQTELDNAIRSIPFSLATASKLQGEEAAQEFKDTVMEEIETAIKNVEKEMMRKFIDIIKEKLYTFPLSIGQLVDPDNFVGVDYRIITLEELMDKGSIQIPMDFNSCGDCDAHYKLNVSVKKMN